MNFSVVTLDAPSTHEAVAMMRELGYRNTGELRCRLLGIRAEDIMVHFEIFPAVVRFQRSNRILGNAYYWTAEQERAIAYRCAEYAAFMVAQWREDDAA